jgi:NAD(P)H dehydrogenase (quinone)
MILVTGAGGKTGRAVVRALAARGAQVRALVRGSRPEPAAALRALGAEVVPGDMRLPADLAGAMQGASAVYHICPNVHPDEVPIGQAAIAAAQAAGVGHFVFHSVLHPQTEAMPHHWHKLRVEESLFTSGLPFTILQPAPYMQNVLAGWAAINERGVFTVPYPVETRLSLVDLEDVAQAAARVLGSAAHHGAVYELAGTPPLSQQEVAAALAQQLGRPVAAVSELVDTWERRVRAGGLAEGPIATLKQMFDYYARFGLPGNPNVLTWLLGRPPASYAKFAARVAKGQAA